MFLRMSWLKIYPDFLLGNTYGLGFMLYMKTLEHLGIFYHLEAEEIIRFSLHWFFSMLALQRTILCVSES